MDVELPHGFPKTEQEAKTHAEFAGVPPDFAVKTWNTAMGRGGRDAKECPIMLFRNYLKAQWTYEQDRVARNNHHPAPSAPPAPALSANIQTMRDQEDLKRVEAEIKRLKDNASSDAFGPKFTVAERKHLSALKGRREQLIKSLGFTS